MDNEGSRATAEEAIRLAKKKDPGRWEDVPGTSRKRWKPGENQSPYRSAGPTLEERIAELEREHKRLHTNYWGFYHWVMKVLSRLT